MAIAAGVAMAGGCGCRQGCREKKRQKEQEKDFLLCVFCLAVFDIQFLV
ncbi:hypothetical protein LIQ25_21290 [Blautia glucerasea]|nr:MULTISPECIES: hypothetical protein [Blautia]MCB5384947.1 hypothetical protein [Blautia glucerasea]NSJ71555.1 hypothetical protein [Blautia faecis]